MWRNVTPEPTKAYTGNKGKTAHNLHCLATLPLILVHTAKVHQKHQVSVCIRNASCLCLPVLHKPHWLWSKAVLAVSILVFHWPQCLRTQPHLHWSNGNLTWNVTQDFSCWYVIQGCWDAPQRTCGAMEHPACLCSVSPLVTIHWNIRSF